jgi:hypothetical protein
LTAKRLPRRSIAANEDCARRLAPSTSGSRDIAMMALTVMPWRSPSRLMVSTVTPEAMRRNACRPRSRAVGGSPAGPGGSAPGQASRDRGGCVAASTAVVSAPATAAPAQGPTPLGSPPQALTGAPRR